MRFTCPDGTANAGESAVFSGKCKKLPKNTVGLNCNNELQCNCEDEIDDIVAAIGGSAAAVCTDDSKKPTWKIWCDDDADRNHDNGESSETVSGKCKKLAKQSSLAC